MKECAIVLGMHRSGTSVLAGLVSLFGGYIGSDIMPPTKDNPKGYFENNKIYQLNEKILKENNASWDDFLFSVDDINEENTIKYINQAKEIIKNDLKYIKKTIIKDPRLCILFPIWEKALNQLGVNIKLIFMYRSPMEVAHSLEKRDGIPIEKGLMLWSHYFLQSEYYSRRYERIIVEYDYSFKELSVLLESIACLLEVEVSDEIVLKSRGFYSPSLKHHQVSLDNISNDLPSYLVSLIDLLKINDFSHPNTFDDLKSEFTYSKKYYLYNNTDQEKKIEEKNDKIRKKDIEIEKQYVTIENKNNELDSQRVTIENKNNELDSQRVKIENKNNELKSQRVKIENKNNELESQGVKIEKQNSLLENQSILIEKNNNEFENKYIEIKIESNHELEKQNVKIEDLNNELKNKNKNKQEMLKSISEYKIRIDDLYLYLSNGENIYKDLTSTNSLYNKIYKVIGSTALLQNAKSLTYFGSKKKNSLALERKLICESGLFSEFYYLSRYPDIWKARIDPLDHYCRMGWKEDRRPSSNFDSVVYKKNHPEVVSKNINPLLHYLQSKKHEPVKDNLEKSTKDNHLKFDAEFYLKNNQDVKNKGVNPYKHFTDIGWKEGRDPNAYFSVDFYIKTNPDIKRARVNPFFHYISKGYSENRLPTLPRKIRTIQPPSTAPSILFIGHSGAQGGAEIILLDIIQWYAKNTNYKISIILLSPGILAGQLMRYGNVLTLNSSDELITQESDDFLDFHYDLIYLNTVISGDFSAVYKKKYAKLNIPIVLHVHEMQNIIEMNKKSFEGIVKSVDLFIAASTRVKDDLVTYYAIAPETISVYHSFVQNNATNSSKLSRQVNEARQYFNLSDDDIVIMGSGTVNWRKAPDLFIETLAKIIKQCREKNIIGIWMGAGEDLVDLQEKIDQQGLNDNIRFTGFLTNASELVAAADIFFLSSREDPFPLVCLEAAQYKIPSVCFQQATGMIEFIQDDAGVAIAEIDTDLASCEIVALINDNLRREKLGFIARARFLNKYSSEHQIHAIFHQLKHRYTFKPSVTTIIPNYNHESYLKERIDSVVKQSFYDQEVLILDDASVDNSLTVIADYENDPRITLIKNKKSSGSPFKQWQKGIKKSAADYIWIAESDDSAANNFLENLLSAFNDKNVVLSYCKSKIIDEKSELVPNALDPYMERAHPTKFNASYVMDGNKEVEQNFAVACTIVNASSVIFKKDTILDSLDVAMKFKMCGDWLIYLQALCNGKIAYSIGTTNYFRRHQTSTVHKVEGTELYFKERFKIAKEVIRKFNISEIVLKKMLTEIDSEWKRFAHIDKKKSYEVLFNKIELQEDFEKNTVKPMKIGFYVHGFMFSKGGIERLVADLANYLSNRGHKIIIYCRIFNSDKPIYKVNNDIVVIPVFDESKANIKSSTKRLREKLKDEKLDVFIPMLSEWIFTPVIEAAKGLGFPIIASEHNNPDVIEAQWWSHKERVEIFEQVDIIHLLRDDYKSSLPDTLQKNIRVIPNGSYLGNWLTANHKKTYKRIIAVGRLSPQKRFDRLIHAFALVVKDIDNEWQLDIYGDGPDKKKLHNIIKHYQLEDRIVLKGNKDNIEREYLSSDFFVLPSEFEGDPVVLVEAKMFALPCIGYENCSGTNEAIHHDIDGLLVKSDENGKSLAYAIIELIHNDVKREQFSLAAKKDAKQLSMRIVANKWEMLLKDVVCLT
ncbi:MAG: glycosyltransferase [Cocleimonas sp.]|nr:glycosyltransferase [Cocleimonas sp.]